MDTADLLRIQEDNKKDIFIFNPLPYDFTWSYDRVEYTIKSQENESFKPHIAKHLAKHIVDAYINTRDKGYTREQAEKLVLPND